MRGNRCITALVLAASLLPIACARTQPAELPGEVLYRRHCASCHGMTGRGDGPVAPALKRPPSDLTTLVRRSGKQFDEGQLMELIDGRRLVAEHGPREMPVWGAVFDAELKDDPYAHYTGLLRSRTLVEHLRTMQRE